MAFTFSPKNTTVPKQTIEPKGTKYVIRRVFPASIELDELSISGVEEGKTQKPEDSMSIEFPLLKINDYIFNRDEIVSMEIDCTEFLPKISLSVIFLSQVFLSKDMPKDGDIISLAIRNRIFRFLCFAFFNTWD